MSVVTRTFGDRRFLVVGELELLPRSFLQEYKGRGSELLRCAPNLRSAIAIVRSERFDCIIVDRDMEDGDGLVLAPTIKRIHPKATSILISKKAQWATTEAARDLGFSEVIVKSHVEETLIERLTSLLLNAGDQSKVELRKISRIYLLSIREREILNDIATGATTGEIAMQRHISVATIKSHLTSIYRKLGVRNRVEAIAELRRY